MNEKKPELLEKVKAGTMTLPQATREVRRDEKREALKAKADASPILPVDQSWDLITGDCIDELAKMKAGSARLIFADPPYNIGIDYGGGLAWLSSFTIKATQIFCFTGVTCDEIIFT